MNFTITIDGIGPLVAALHDLAAAWRNTPTGGVRSTIQTIAPEDRPDAGRDVSLALLQPALAVPEGLPAWLGSAVTQFTPPAALTGAAPLPVQGSAAVPFPPPLPAPSIAVAAAAPTAPVAPPATSAVPPSVPQPPALPPAPSAVAPAVPAALASPAGPGVDKTGLPWDPRIHADASKKTDPKPVNKDGTWRQKRGTADTFVAEITKQLRAAVAANAGASTVPFAPPAAPVPPVALVPPPVPPALAAALPGLTFADLCHKLEQAFVTGRLTLENTTPVLAKHGLQQFNQLMHAPALVAHVDAELSAMLGVAPGKPA